MNTWRVKTFSADDMGDNLSTTIVVNMGQPIALRLATIPSPDTPVFCVTEWRQLYLRKNLSEPMEPPANVTSGVIPPLTQRPPPDPEPETSRTTPR